MPAHAATPRLAIAQIPMHWELHANVVAMQSAMAVAHAAGASLCLFSELALTGFHRRVVEWAKPELVSPAVQAIQSTAASLGLPVAFGAPTFGHAGQPLNSHLFVAGSGAIVGVVPKVGLTAPEATFFSPGTSRPVISLAGLACSAVICREVEDEDDVMRQLGGEELDLVFWPGQMRPDPAKPVHDPPEHVVQAQALARGLGAYVIQTNWPNALNRPEESESTGHSACISPIGELLFRLPRQGFGIGVFSLGASVYEWHPSGA